MKAPKHHKNDPRRAGQSAGRAVLFGEFSRYRVEPVHVRDLPGRESAVQWFVFDAEVEDELTGKPKIVRQEDNFADAVRGLS